MRGGRLVCRGCIGLWGIPFVEGVALREAGHSGLREGARLIRHEGGDVPYRLRPDERAADPGARTR